MALGFGVEGFWGLGFRVWRLGCGVWGAESASIGPNAMPPNNTSSHHDPPCTLNWGYMVPNSRYLGPNRG